MTKRTRISLIALGLVVCCALFLAYLLRGVRNAIAAIHQSDCQHHLAWIYGALRDYHQKYGHFPPAYIADKDGKPMHSWRVLVLETLNEPLSTEIYRAYRFDEPWDGPNNRKLIDRMPDFYACPSDSRTRADGKRLANYVVIVGPDTAFHGPDSIVLSPSPDIHDDTIVLAETLPGIPWTEPRDLDLGTMSFRINDPEEPSIASKDWTGPGVALMDGRIERLRAPVDPARIRSMILVRPRAAPSQAPEPVEAAPR